MNHTVQIRSENVALCASNRALGECVTLFAEIYQHTVKPPTAKLWVEKLGQYDADEIRTAFDDWVSRETHFPTISDVLALINRNKFGGENDQWLRAYKVAQSGPSDGRFIVFDHPAIHFAIETLGGLKMLQRRIRSENDFSFARRDFISALNEYHDRQTYVSGFGTFNGSNAVLIGNAEHALCVFAKSRTFSHEGHVPGLELLRDEPIGIGAVELPPALLPEHLFIPYKKTALSNLAWMTGPGENYEDT